MKKNNLNKENKEFKVPDDYFESFEDHLFDSLKDTSIIPKDDGFKIPSGYIETLDDKILSTHKKSKIVKLNSKRTYYYTFIGIAASIALIIMLQIPSSTTHVNFADLQEIEIEDYFNQNDVSLNAYEVAQVYDDIDLSEIQIVSEAIEDNDLINYLSDSATNYDEFIIEE